MMRKRPGFERGAVAARLYALLLAAYPAEFRREYGREMRLVFADRCREGRVEGGAGVARVVRETLFDLARTAARERLECLLKGGRLMRIMRTVVLAALAYAFTLLVVAPLYARNAGSMPGFVANLADALIFTGLVFNFIFQVLTLTRWREGVRAVRASLALTAGIVVVLITVMMMSLGRPAHVNLRIVVAQVLGLFIWYTIHLWWVLRRRAPAPPSAA